MKNVFYFTLKAVFVLKIFKFLCWLFGHVEKQLYWRHKIILKFLKFLTSQPGKQTIAILILPNISERKGHQIMKFGQLIEYNISNIFLENHTENSVEKLFPDPFLKNQNVAYLWIDRLKFYAVCFYCMPSWVLCKHIETNLWTTCFCLIWSFFKNKRLAGTSLPASWFWKKNVSHCILLTDQISLYAWLLFVRYCKISWEWKELLRWNKKHISSF